MTNEDLKLIQDSDYDARQYLGSRYADAVEELLQILLSQECFCELSTTVDHPRGVKGCAFNMSVVLVKDV